MADGASTIPAERREVAVAARPARRSPWLRRVLLAVGPLVLLVGAAWFYFTGGRYVSTDNAYVEANLIELSTDVSGIVKSIEVTDNEAVKPGQVLFRLQDATYRFAVANARAQLAAAQNAVEKEQADLREKQQDLKLRQIDLDFAQRDWNRKHSLFLQHVVPQSAMDQAQQALDAARQQIEAVKRQEAAIVAELSGNPALPIDRQPAVEAAQAKLDSAERDLRNTVVRAPVAGIVTRVPQLQVGHYLPASTAAFGLVESGALWVEANPKETQLTWVRPGEPATVSVDTYPGVEWHGRVASISPASGSQFAVLPAQNTSGNWVKVVQRIPLRIALHLKPGEPTLRAGMSAEVDIDTGHRRSLGTLLDSLGL